MILAYNRALSDSEIQQIYNDPMNPPTDGLVLWLAPDSVDVENGIWHDKSGNGHDGTIYGATPVDAAPPAPAISTVQEARVGDTITVTLNTTDPGSVTSYKYRLEDGSGNVLVDWTEDEDGQFTYTIPQSLAHGTLVIKAKAVNLLKIESEEQTANVTIANSPPTEPTLSVSPGTVATPGDTITATALGSSDPDGDSITYEYKFEDVTANVTLQDWSTTNSYTTNINQADHVIRVWARAYDGYGGYSNPVYIDVNLNNHPPTEPTTIYLTSGLHVGKQVTIAASGSTDEDGDSITYEYRIVDKTTGSVIRDWSSTNTWTPSSGQLYHTIEIFARAKDPLGAASDAVSRVYFVLPGETIADVPFDPGQVKSKVIFTLSSAWTDVTGLKVKLDGQTSGAGTLFLLASFNGVHWWVNITGDKVILYSDSPLGFMYVPTLSRGDVGSNKWAKDYIQTFVDFAQQAGTLEGSAIGSGTYIQSYDAYVAGINQEAVAYAVWLYASMDWRTDWITWNLENVTSLLSKVYVEWGVPDADSFKLDIYDIGESPGSSPEYTSGASSGVREFTASGLTSWLLYKTVNFYMYQNPKWGGGFGVRFIAVGPTEYTPPTGSVQLEDGYSSHTEGRIIINVKPLPVPTKVTFWFYDENNNPLNGVDVYLGDTFIGTFDSGQSYQLDYAGTYTFTAKKLHYVDTTVTTYVEGNAGVSFTLPLQSYDVTVRITDEHGNLINATLYIDGQSYGTVDETTVTLKYGSHTFRAVDAQGYSGETTAIIDHDGQVVTVKITHPVLVTFLIYDASNLTNLSQLTPMTAVTLYIDGSPHVIDSGDSMEVLPGTHKFIFVKDGYLNVTLNAEIKSDTTITVYMFKGVAVGFEAPSMTIDITDEGIDEVIGLFGHWPGGEFLKDLFHLDLKGFLKDLFGMKTTAGGRPATWVGTFLALVIWLQGTLAVWFYHKNPIITLMFGRLLYEGLSQFVTFNPAVLAAPVAAFSLYMGYLVLKNIMAKWSGGE